jgi:hypothetical protein
MRVTCCTESSLVIGIRFSVFGVVLLRAVYAELASVWCLVSVLIVVKKRVGWSSGRGIAGGWHG